MLSLTLTRPLVSLRLLQGLKTLLRGAAPRRAQLGASEASRLWSRAESSLSEMEREARMCSFGPHWASTGLEMPEVVEEAYALFHATRNAMPINRALRGERASGARLALARLTASALERLAPTPGLSFRGARMPAQVLASHQVGQQISDRAFLCATSNSEVAQERLQRALLPGEVRVMMSIYGRTGRSVGTAEAQVLFLPGTSFRVERRENGADGVVYLTLVEV